MDFLITVLGWLNEILIGWGLWGFPFSLLYSQGGIVVLLLTLCLQAYVNNGGRRLAVDVGSSRRLHALTAIVSTLFLCPLALMVWMTQVRINFIMHRRIPLRIFVNISSCFIFAKKITQHRYMMECAAMFVYSKYFNSAISDVDIKSVIL